MEELKLSDCINCGRQNDAIYCGNCGQRNSVQRLRWSTLFQELNERLLGLDSRFIRTVRDLTIKPGAVVRAFIDGNRVKYIGPVGYFFILLTIYVLIISIFEIDMIEFSKGLTSTFNTEESVEATIDLQQSLMAHMKLFTFILMPLFILGTYFVFRKKKYNILETAVMTFYAHAHPLILTFFSLFLFKYSGLTNVNYVFPVAILYMGFICASFYDGNKGWNFLKGIFSYFIGFLIFLIVIAVLTVALTFIDPELLKSILKIKN